MWAYTGTPAAKAVYTVMRHKSRKRRTVEFKKTILIG